MKKSEFLVPVFRNRFKLLMKLCIMMLIISFESAAFNSLFAQQPQTREIKGTITDQKGGTLGGVTVMVKGTTIGVLTSPDGKYTLSNVPQNATIVFSFIGMISQEFPSANQTRIDVVLIEQTVSLEEVVVVGYGAQKKESIVGSISQTTNAKLQQAGNVPNLGAALTGQLPGVITLQASGEPGGSGANTVGSSATAVYIRGRNTWNGGQPLILVDGIERDMYNMDVSEVENISILKDASATAVFGVKGANGVILITTKRGSAGKTKISFNYATTGQFVSKLPAAAGSFEAQQARNQAIEREVPLNEPSWAEIKPYELTKRYLHNDPAHPEYDWIYPDVDWEKAMFKDMGVSHRATLNVQGGTAFVKYFGSMSYLHEGDMLRKYNNGKGYDPNYNFDRFNFRSNLDFTLSKTTKLQVNLSGYVSNKNVNWAWTQATYGEQGEMWSSVYNMPPDIYLPRYSDGRWGWDLSTGKVNPVAFAQNLGVRYYRATQLNSDFALDQNLDVITKGLSAKVQFYYDNVINSTGGSATTGNHIRPNEDGSNTLEKYVNSALYTGDPNQPESEYVFNIPTVGLSQSQFDFALPYPGIAAEAASANATERRMQYQFMLNYNRRFGLHNVTALGAMKRQEYARGSMFKNYREDWIFRTAYDYDSKYLFEVNGAYNGSEQFGPGYRFDFFPSLALGYLISNEKFFPIDWMNRLKFRYSIGMVGDDNVSGGRWLYSDQFAYGGFTRLNMADLNNGSSPYTWYKQTTIGNQSIHWEKATKNNFGVEMGLFHDMFSITYDYFTEDRTDILLAGGSRAVPTFFGGTPPPANLGQVKSNGHELEVRLDKRRPGGFHYWAALALTHTSNKIIFKDDPQLLFDYQKAAGHTINQTYSSIRANRYNSWDDIYASVPMETADINKLPGFWNIIDFNADGIIKSDDSVPTDYSDIPQNTYNFTLGADYKGFSVMVQLYGVTNVSRSQSLSNFSGRTDVWFEYMRDYWSRDNQDGTSFMPRWRTSGGQTGDYWLFDGSYLRLKTAEIAYTFQDKFVKNANLGGLRIYLNGNNLAFWSKMLDDREGSFSGGSSSGGAYPTVSRVNLGVEVTF